MNPGYNKQKSQGDPDPDPEVDMTGEAVLDDSGSFGGRSPGRHDDGSSHLHDLDDELAMASDKNADLAPEEMVKVLQAERQNLEISVKSLAEQLQKQKVSLKQQQEEHRATMLHTETLSMMTKYQLVFVKLESSLLRISKTNQYKEHSRLKKGFQAFHMNKLSKKVSEKYSAQLIFQDFRVSLRNLKRISERRSATTQQTFFHRWQRQILVEKVSTAISVKYTNKYQEIQKSIAQKNGEIDRLRNDSKQSEVTLKALMKKEEDYHIRIRELEGNEESLQKVITEQQETIQLQQRNPGRGAGSIERDEDQAGHASVRSQAKELQIENQDLKQRLSATEVQVAFFINEMSDLLDAHEPTSSTRVGTDDGSTLHDSHDFDHFEDDEQTAGAGGTGGSRVKGSHGGRGPNGNAVGVTSGTSNGARKSSKTASSQKIYMNKTTGGLSKYK